jgi:hypothetical protein
MIKPFKSPFSKGGQRGITKEMHSVFSYYSLRVKPVIAFETNSERI